MVVYYAYPDYDFSNIDVDNMTIKILFHHVIYYIYS